MMIEIDVAGINFIGRRPICGHYLQGEECTWALPTRTVTLGHRSHLRWSQRGNQGLVVMNLHPTYIVLNDAIADILSLTQMCFGLFRNVRSCGMSNILWLVVRFSIRTTLWLQRSTRLCSSRASVARRKTTGKEVGRI